MRRTARISLLLASLLVTGMCLAQGPGQRGFNRMRGGSQLMYLMEDIQVLNRLVGLQLTDAQISDLLAAYGKIPAYGPDEQPDERLTKLQELRARLLAGNVIMAGDMVALRDIFRGPQRGPGGQGGQGGNQRPDAPDRGPQTLSPLGQAIWALLTPAQQEVLLSGVQGPAANGQKVERAQAADFIKKLGALRQLDEAVWPTKREAMAEALASGAGAPGSPERNNRKQLFVDFLDRLRRMSDADFAQKGDELAAELEALAPPGTALSVVWAQLEPAVIVVAMEQSFLHWRGQALLVEIQQARAKTAQQ